jgi:hypothetical protein
MEFPIVNYRIIIEKGKYIPPYLSPNFDMGYGV